MTEGMPIGAASIERRLFAVYRAGLTRLAVWNSEIMQSAHVGVDRAKAATLYSSLQGAMLHLTTLERTLLGTSPSVSIR